MRLPLIALVLALMFAGFQIGRARIPSAPVVTATVTDTPTSVANEPLLVDSTTSINFNAELSRDIQTFITNYCKKMDKFEDEVSYNEILANHGADMTFFWQMYSIRKGKDPSAPPGGQGVVGFGIGRREHAEIIHGAMGAVIKECVKSQTVLSKMPRTRVNEVIVEYLDEIAPLTAGRKTPQISEELRSVRKQLQTQRTVGEWETLRAEETRLIQLLEGR